MVLSENIVGNGKIIVSDPSWHWNHVDFTNAQVPQKCGWCESCILPLVAILKSIACVAPEGTVNVKNPWDCQNLQWSSVNNVILGHVELHVLRNIMMMYIYIVASDTTVWPWYFRPLAENMSVIPDDSSAQIMTFINWKWNYYWWLLSILLYKISEVSCHS